VIHQPTESENIPKPAMKGKVGKLSGNGCHYELLSHEST